MKMNFTIAVAPLFVHPMASLLAIPNHSVRKYGFLLGGDKWQNTATMNLSFSGDIESLEPSKF